MQYRMRDRAEAHTLSRKIVLATVGSLGDLHPFIALGRALQDRGAQVRLACAGEYRRKVETAGLEFYELRPNFDEIQRDLGMNREQLTRQILKHSDFLFQQIVLPYVRQSYEDMMSAAADADLILTSSLAFGARLAAEKRAIPWIGVVLQPMMFLSAYDPPVLAGAEWFSALLTRLGVAATRGAFAAIKFGVRWRFRRLHQLRLQLGLAPSRLDPLFDGQFSAAGAIGLYSDLLGPVQPDYPRPTSIVGFAAFDSADGSPAALQAPLEAFLGAGTPPLVFTLGSLIVHSAGDFFSRSLELSRYAKRRAVLLVGEDSVERVQRLACADIFVCGYAPHSLLFPRAAAIVHHGGIGTLAQALRAGRPQLIVPYFADQVDNAARAARLGVARVINPRRFHRSSAAAHMQLLLAESGHYGARAREVAVRLAADDGAGRAARIILDTLQ